MESFFFSLQLVRWSLRLFWFVTDISWEAGFPDLEMEPLFFRFGWLCGLCASNLTNSGSSALSVDAESLCYGLPLPAYVGAVSAIPPLSSWEPKHALRPWDTKQAHGT